MMIKWRRKWQQAAFEWENLLVEYPKDVLALKLAHDTYFYLGEQTQIRDSISRVLPHFSRGDPYYGYVQICEYFLVFSPFFNVTSYLKGMLSFGQEETNLLRQAEECATEVITSNLDV